MNKKTLLASAILVAAGMATTSVHAARLSSQLEFDTLNTFEDQSREVIVDVDGDGFLSVGDVFMGFLRIDDRTAPGGGPDIDTQELYGAFAIEVTGLDDRSGNGVDDFITYGASTVAGLQLQDVTGDLNVNNTDVAAVYSDIGTDLINVNLTTGAGDILTQTTAVSNGTLEITLAITEADDFFESSGVGIESLVAGTGLATLFDATIGLGFGDNSITAGLTVNENETGFVEFEELVPVFGSAGLSIHEFTLANGSLSGACDLYSTVGDPSDCGPLTAGADPSGANPLFGTITAAGETYDYYGLSNNLDASVYPIPVPAPLALLGLGLLGIGVARKHRRTAA